MEFKQPSFESDNEKVISRRDFLKKTAAVGGALIVGAAGIKIAQESDLINKPKEKKEVHGKGLILEKKHLPGLAYPSANGFLSKLPDRYILEVKINDETFKIKVSKEQFNQYNVNDVIPIDYEIDDEKGIESPKLYNKK